MNIFRKRQVAPLSAAVGAAMAVLYWAGVAWACVGVVSLTTAAKSVQAGGTLMVTGREFAAGGAPVVIHLDTITGPVLATVPVPGDDTMSSKWTVSVTLPSDLASGQHVLVATQDAHDMNSGAPARSVFYVGDVPPAPAAPHRPAALAVERTPSLIGLTLVALVVAGLGLAVAGAWSWLSSRPGGSATSPAGLS